MRSRTTAAVVAGALVGTLVLPTASAAAAPDELRLSEIRIDQSGSDTDEYAELTGTPGASLDGVTYLVIGDGSTGSGTVEAVVDLAGSALGDNGSFLLAESSFSLATPDLVASLNFENSDNVTHLLVDGFTGANGDDLDGDDDGALDSTPWTAVIDAIGLVETPDSGDAYYGAALGFTDIGPDGSYVPAHVFRDEAGAWQIGDYGFGDDTPTSGGSTEPEPEPVCDTPSEDLTLLSEVQGPGDFSPLHGDEVTVRAVVTLSTDTLGGYFLQEEPADSDGDPSTSEGIYVHDPRGGLPEAGATIELTDRVSSYWGLTQFSRPEIEVCDVEPVEIPATPLTLPLDDAGREALEGMVVTTTQDLQVTRLFTAYRYGELGLALDGPLLQPTAVHAPSDPAATALAEDNAARQLVVNDRDQATSQFDPFPWELFDEDLSAGDTMQAGDVVGPLNYTFGEFKVEPIGRFPETVDTDTIAAVPTLADGNDVAALNVLNYFNTFGDSAVLRGATNAEDFALQTDKIVDAILEMDAAVIGLVELENDYEDHYDADPATVPSVQTLVEALNDRAGAGTYDWVVPGEDLLTTEGLGGGGLGTDAIAVGFVYQPARATEIGTPATFDIDAELTGDSENNRWPLAQTFDIDGETVTLVVNHFKSKGSTCTDTAGPGFDLGDDVETDLTGNCNLVREYAAQRILDWVETKPTGANTPDTLVIGDLNAYDEEGPIQVFEDADWTDVIERDGDDAFTYKFDGRFGRLDHVLASPSAKRLVTDAAVWQVNSRAPYGYLYDNSPQDDYPLFFGSSDHDPVLVSLDKPGNGNGKGKGR